MLMPSRAASSRWDPTGSAETWRIAASSNSSDAGSWIWVDLFML